MTGKQRASEASQNRRTRKTPHGNWGGKNLDSIEGSETSFPTASTSKKLEEKKPHKAPSSLKEDTPHYNTIGNRSTSGPKTLDGSSHKLAFRSKGKQLVDCGFSKDPGNSLGGEAGKNACNPHSVLLVVDLNSRNPTVAFIAPSLGYSEHEFLPALKAMLKSREAFLTSTKFGLGSRQPCQSSSDWTTDFLSHSRLLLQSKIGMPLEDAILGFSFTARGDASDRSKAMLLGAVKAAGFKINTDDAIQIFPTVEAVTIETVRHQITKIFDNQSPYPGGAPKFNHNILVLHYDGDVAEIQSYSVSWEAKTRKSGQSRLRLEEIAYGETVDCGELVDYHFTRWMEERFGNSVSNVSTNNIGTDGGLMAKFAEERRKYKLG
jgi:hypothetical protein